MCSLGLNEWGNIFTIVLGLSSLITAYATIRALNTQNHIQRESMVLQQKSQQPIFKISYELNDYDSDYKYDTSIIHIYNEGAATLYINDISIKTFFTIEINHKEYQFEITDFYFAQSMPQSLTGEVYEGLNIQNYSSFCKLYDAAMSKTVLPNEFYAIKRFDLIKIEYIDINQNKCAIYYKNREPITDKDYQDLCSQTINPNDQLDIEKVTLDDMLHYIESL